MSFVKNDNQQLTLLDSTFNLTEREKRMLEKSWANTFADKVFPAIDENIFSVLYSKKASRPNTPVNVIVICLIMQYNGNEIYATRYMKSLFLFGRRWIGYFRLYLTGVRYFCMRSMDSVSLPSCLRYALHMFTAFETDLLCIWSIN